MNGIVTQASLRSEAQSVTQDWPRLQRYLASQGMALATVPPPRQFAGGLANLNYLVRIDGRDAVLRRPPMGPLPPGAYDMGRESKILSGLWRQFPLAPRAMHLCEDTSVIGAAFQITEYRRGSSFRETLPPPLAGSTAAGARLGSMMIKVLSQLHAVDPAAVGLDSLGKPEGFLQRAVEGWIKRAILSTREIAGTETLTLIDDLARWLRAQPIPAGRVSLIHNDFKLDNVLVDPQTLEPVAVLDWDQGTRGDPLFDLATLLSYWTEAGDPPAMRQLKQMPTMEPGFPSRRQAAEHYARLTGDDLSGFRFHRALAMFKTAVIFQQLYARFRQGGTDDPRYAEFGPLAAGLFEFTNDIAQNRVF